MFEELKKFAEKSYSPYSKFKVAAILESEDGKTYGGANIENIAFPSSLCAERVAISVAKMSDVDFNKIIAIHIFSPNANFILSPCGGCRQVMTEHINQNAKVYMYSNDGKSVEMLLKDLVPLSILPKSFLGSK